MPMSDAEQAFGLIDGIKTAHFHGPKTDELIATAEKALGIEFPPTYRKFLARYGCGSVPGHEFYGLIDDDFENSSVPDGIWLTLDERQTSKLPQTLVIVAETGDGGYYAIDLDQKNADGDSPIVEWWPALPNAAGNRRLVASDFGAFLLQQVRAAA